ncbi:unnamed protein product [Ambrosiozyma monospora]|uniref:Unnamed protein product n=1 Tax=Ambrosiozyma monospora TaxID=43982 RepID=A0ACB5UBM9_AMBMO|nr:unnamed protein product [Ambrosiozyma monospora]
MNSIKRKENKLFKKNFKKKLIVMQNEENSRYLKDKRVQRSGIKTFPHLASDDLMLQLYRDAEECPICFLYFPKNLNVSRCCDQPICTECFVQLKRLDPHPPHDEDAVPGVESNNDPAANNTDLISEPVKCPYCAMIDFGVTYSPPPFRTGIGGMAPSDYRSIDPCKTHKQSETRNTVNNNTSNQLQLPGATPETIARKRRPNWLEGQQQPLHCMHPV